MICFDSGLAVSVGPTAAEVDHVTRLILNIFKLVYSHIGDHAIRMSSAFRVQPFLSMRFSYCWLRMSAPMSSLQWVHVSALRMRQSAE